MEFLTISFLIDLIMLVLLGAAIYYAIKLHRHLENFSKGKAELQSAVVDLVAATEKAELAIQGLRNNAKEIGDGLQEHIEEGQKLFDELQFMNDAGNNLAQRLEKLAERANQSSGAEPKQAKSAPKKKAPKSKAEQELMEALEKKKGKK